MQSLKINPASLPSTECSPASKVDPRLLQVRMKALFSAYRIDQYSDPDGFMTQAALLLSEYPEDVICYVTDPRTGIQRTQKFPPTISEIAAACDARVTAILRQKELEIWRERKRVSDEIKAKGGRPLPEPGGMTFAEFQKRFGMDARPIGRFEKMPERSA
jgi:hypothetical protein